MQIVDVNNNILSTTTTNRFLYFIACGYLCGVSSICGYNYSGWADNGFVTMGKMCTQPTNFGVSTNSGNASFHGTAIRPEQKLKLNTATNNSITTTVGNAIIRLHPTVPAKQELEAECNSSFSSWTDYFTIGSSCAIPYNFSVSTGTSSAYFSWTGNGSLVSN